MIGLFPEHEPECEVLKSHQERYYTAHLNATTSVKQVGYVDKFKEFIAILNEIGSLNIYSDDIDTLSAKHNIPASVKGQVETFLEKSGIYFLAGYRDKFASDLMKPSVSQLKKIEKQASKLRKQIEENYGAFEDFDILSSAGTSDLFPNECSSFHEHQNFAKRLVNDLKRIENMRGKLLDTPSANHIKLGRPGRKGKPENQRWVYLMMWMWTDLLKRNFDHDPQGVNGRERFLIFCEDCFYILHPGAKPDVVRTALALIEKNERHPSNK